MARAKGCKAQQNLELSTFPSEGARSQQDMVEVALSLLPSCAGNAGMACKATPQKKFLV